MQPRQIEEEEASDTEESSSESDEEDDDDEPLAQPPLTTQPWKPVSAMPRQPDPRQAQPKHTLCLHEVLPRPSISESSTMQVVDTSLRVAADALERQSYKFAFATFRAALEKLLRALPTQSDVGASPALRARFEAVSSYCTLCNLLHDCDELRRSVATATGPAKQDFTKKLCLRWACILRMSKAPRHTVIFAVQAMATFFASAQSVGGWVAAHQVASTLLDRCKAMLSAEDIQQVEYVKQATMAGGIARGAFATRGSAVCGACPCCTQPLDALTPECTHCGSEIVVCYKERKPCNARTASFCTLCGAVCGNAATQEVAHLGRGLAGTAGSVKSSRCFMCNVGELRPRGHHAAI